MGVRATRSWPQATDNLSLASVSSTSEDITKGIVSFLNVKIVEALTVPVTGSIVATELIGMKGRDLFRKTPRHNETQGHHQASRHTLPTFCGARSNYEDTWTIKPL